MTLFILALATPAMAQTILSSFFSGTSEGVTYHLPDTRINITVEAMCITSTPGEFYSYAERFLHTKNAIGKASNRWEITGITSCSEGVPCKAKAYTVRLGNSTASNIRLNNKGIISAINTNPAAEEDATAVNALNAIAPIKSMVVSSYQAVSGAGAGGPIELMNEVEALQKGETYEPKVFSHQIAYNLIPQIGGEQVDGYTSEEMKLQNEGRKIMHLPNLKVAMTCVRVPVVRSHSISVALRFDKKLTVQEVRDAIAVAPGCKLVDDLGAKQYPMPLDTSGQDIVFVGRIRPDLTDDNGICLWCCGDQVRKGAATNAIQIAELLTK